MIETFSVVVFDRGFAVMSGVKEVVSRQNCFVRIANYQNGATAKILID
jgi:hypothetical protein